ncbi:hypothetical protein RhiJN_26727 [Ceratobasidium sp. AG-Ba]|nr:hypothetical protein RhiJN_26727 [Ceratobasidium sp. AG-Ba]
MVFTYLVEQPYRLRWITPVFYGVSVVLILVLILLNLILAGYDTVTVLYSNPNVTDYQQWWAPKSLPDALKLHTKPGGCEEARLDRNTPFRTNSSLPLFAYELSNDFNQYASPDNTHGLRAETPYQANPLDICHIEDMMSMTMDPRMLSFNFESLATLLCDPVGDPPRSRQFCTSFSRAITPRFRRDSILSYMAHMASPNQTGSVAYRKISQNGPPKNTYLNVLGVLDTLGSDLLRVMLKRKTIWAVSNQTGIQVSSTVPELAFMSWDPKPNGCSPTDMSRFDSKTFLNGDLSDNSGISAMNTTVVNMFIAVRDAIQ